MDRSPDWKTRLINTRFRFSRPIASLVGLVLILTGCTQRTEMAQQEGSALPAITAAQLQQRLDQDDAIFVLDVRTPAEFNGVLGHVDGATLIPVGELGDRLAELEGVRDRQLHVICRSGNRSARATTLLLNAGFDAVNIAGGMRAYRQLETAPSP